MGTKTIGKVVFGVISVTLAFFTLSLGIFHYMQHSSAEKAKEGNISFSFDKTKSTLFGYIEKYITRI